MGVQPIPLSRLLPAKDSRRSPGDLDELAASIASVGLLNPLCVVEGHDEQGEVGNVWFVVAGRRRLAALKRLHAEDLTFEVPCTLLPEELAAVASGTENLVRLNLDVLEEADAFRMMADAGHEVSRIATMFACSPVRVRQRLQVANAAEPWRHWYRERIIRIEDLQKVAALDEGRQLELAAKCSTNPNNYKASPAVVVGEMGRRIPAKYAKFEIVEDMDRHLVHDFFAEGSPFMDGEMFFHEQRKWLLDFEAKETGKGGLCGVVDHTLGFDKRPHWYHDVQWHAKEHRPKKGSTRKGYVTILELHHDGRVEQTTVDREWFAGIKERQERQEAGKHARAREDAAVIAAAKAEQGGVRTKVFEELLDDAGLYAVGERLLQGTDELKASFLAAYARGAWHRGKGWPARKIEVMAKRVFPLLAELAAEMEAHGHRFVLRPLVGQALDEAVTAAILDIDRSSPSLSIARAMGLQPVWTTPYDLLVKLSHGVLRKLCDHHTMVGGATKLQTADRLASWGYKLIDQGKPGILMPEWRDVAKVTEVGPGADELPDGPEDVSLVGGAGAVDGPSVPPDPDGLEAGAADEGDPAGGASFEDQDEADTVVPIARGRSKERSPRAA